MRLVLLIATGLSQTAPAAGAAAGQAFAVQRAKTQVPLHRVWGHDLVWRGSADRGRRLSSIFVDDSRFANVTCNPTCSAEAVGNLLGSPYLLQQMDLKELRDSLVVVHNRNCSLEALSDCKMYLELQLMGTLRKEMTTIHIVMICCVVAVTLLVYMCLMQLEYRRQQAYLNKLPHEGLPVGRNQLSQTMHKVIVEESARLASEACSMQPAENAPPADRGWGVPQLSEDKALTHFRTSIINSFFVLEKESQKFDEYFSRLYNQSVRDFMAVLKQRFKDISTKLCTEYVECYEKARFSEEPISVEEYNEFQQIWLELVMFIKSQPINPKAREAALRRAS
eukprot:g7188.t1